MGFVLACLGHRYRAVAGSNPALPTISCFFFVCRSEKLLSTTTFCLVVLGFVFWFLGSVWVAGWLWGLLVVEWGILAGFTGCFGFGDGLSV